MSKILNTLFTSGAWPFPEKMVLIVLTRQFKT